MLGRTLRVDHVEQYKIPKDPDRLDEDALKILQEGCGPESSVMKMMQGNQQPAVAALPPAAIIKEEKEPVQYQAPEKKETKKRDKSKERDRLDKQDRPKGKDKRDRSRDRSRDRDRGSRRERSRSKERDRSRRRDRSRDRSEKDRRRHRS